MHDEPSFSLNDFKRWMGTQKDKPRKSKLIGLHVESKLVSKKLLEVMEVQEGDVYDIAKDFRRNGGIITAIDEDLKVIVETDSGSFRIPKYFLKNG